MMTRRVFWRGLRFIVDLNDFSAIRNRGLCDARARNTSVYIAWRAPDWLLMSRGRSG